MAGASGWRVVVHTDDVSTPTAFVYTLHAACGLPVAEAFEAMSTAARCGSVQLAEWSDRMVAEMAVARLQVHGVRATIVAG